MNITKRWVAVPILSDDLDRVLLIHKLKPAFQKDRANFSGGHLEDQDWPCNFVNGEGRPCTCEGYIASTDHRSLDPEKVAYQRCAAREIAEETGLVIPPHEFTLFCRLRFVHEGVAGEVAFLTCKGDIDRAQTKEAERIFISKVDRVFKGEVSYVSCWRPGDGAVDPQLTKIPTMPNLPWLLGMAIQTLRGSSAPPFLVLESSAQ